MLSHYAETLSLFADESRLRLCALLQHRELRVTDLVRVTGISQPRVSSHLGRLKEAGFVRNRRQGTQAFYGLLSEQLPAAARAALAEAASSGDPLLSHDRTRLQELEAERRGEPGDWNADDLEHDYSPGRSWRSLALGLTACLELGDVLDVGCGDGCAAACLASGCASLTAIDIDPVKLDLASQRLARFSQARVQLADVHHLPFGDATFDIVLLFHTLTYAERPKQALRELARVLRPSGRAILLCLDEHRQQELTKRYGERHPGFSPKTLKSLLGEARLEVMHAGVAYRENRKPHLQVVLAAAQKPVAASPNGRRRAPAKTTPLSSRTRTL